MYLRNSLTAIAFLLDHLESSMGSAPEQASASLSDQTLADDCDGFDNWFDKKPNECAVAGGHKCTSAMRTLCIGIVVSCAIMLGLVNGVGVIGGPREEPTYQDIGLVKQYENPAYHRKAYGGPTGLDDDPSYTDDGPGLTDDGPGLTDDGPGLTDDGPRPTDDGPGLTDDGPDPTDDGPGLTDDAPGLTDDAPDDRF